jgi:hypothetical protein
MLAREDPDAVGEGVGVALADCEASFRAREDNKRMKDQAARFCRALVASPHDVRPEQIAHLIYRTRLPGEIKKQFNLA